MACWSLMRPVLLKKGQASCGVGQHYTGSAGTITNCQIGVFGAYVLERGHAFIDLALYPPKRLGIEPCVHEADSCSW